MKKITILLLHMQHGGIEKQSITFANELSKKYDVTIISTYSMQNKPAYEVDSKVKIKYLINDKPNRVEFKKALKSKNIIEIIKQGFKSIKILYLKKHLLIKEVKKLDADYVLSTRVEQAEILSKYAPKSVVTLTQEHLHNDSEKYIKRLKKAFRNINYLVVLGPGSKENYSKWLKENEKIKIVQIPNILEKLPNENSSLNNNNIVSVGRLHPEKGFEDLIQVFNKVQKEIPNLTLNIVGGGEELDNLKKLIQQLNLEEKIKMPGMVSKEQVEEYLKTADLYVMTSIAECFPMVLLEASSYGLPLISFDVPVGPRAIISNDENGYLIQNRNIDEMANKIVELLKDKQKLKQLGKTSKEMSQKYLSENVMPLWYEIFDKN